MSTLRPTSAKIIQHAEGLGAPNADQVRRRAAELAFIDGRVEPSDEDWRQAKRELHGGHDHNGNNDELEMTILVSEHDGVVTDLGHHVENMRLDDNENIVEELITEGMDEAVHEQMIASRREDVLAEDDDIAGDDDEIR